MRRSLLILPALAFLLGAGAIEQQALKMGYVDSEEILRSSADAAAAEQAFEEELQGYQAEIRASVPIRAMPRAVAGSSRR